MCSHWTRQRTSARERAQRRRRARFNKKGIGMAEASKGDKTAAMRIDPALVRELAALLTDNELTEIEVEDGDRRIKVKREAAPIIGAAAPSAAAVAPAL